MKPVGLRRAAVERQLGQEATLYRDAREQQIVRVHSGGYVRADAWNVAHTEERLRYRAQGVAARAHRIPPVFSHVSAGALRGLPLFRVRSDQTHVTVPVGSGRRSRGAVVRHAGELRSDDVDVVDGLLVTSLVRTVFDIARTATPECAVAAADGALRQVGFASGTDFREEAAEVLRNAVDELVAGGAGTAGVRQARFVVRFADGRAQLPGESISRLWMERAGSPPPVLQLPVALDHAVAFLDFAWPELGVFGEFDGDGKYVDPALMNGRTKRDVLRDQRRRETAIVARTGWRPIRWGWDRLVTPAAFAAFLRSHGVC